MTGRSAYFGPAVYGVVPKPSIVVHLIWSHDDRIDIADQLSDVFAAPLVAIHPNDLVASYGFQIVTSPVRHQLSVLEHTHAVQVEHLLEHGHAAFVAEEVVQHAHSVQVHVADNEATHVHVIAALRHRDVGTSHAAVRPSAPVARHCLGSAKRRRRFHDENFARPPPTEVTIAGDGTTGFARRE